MIMLKSLNKIEKDRRKMMPKEIVERSSGYWIVDDHGVVDGPFIELNEALKKKEEHDD